MWPLPSGEAIAGLLLSCVHAAEMRDKEQKLAGEEEFLSLVGSVLELTIRVHDLHLCGQEGVS